MMPVPTRTVASSIPGRWRCMVHGTTLPGPNIAAPRGTYRGVRIFAVLQLHSHPFASFPQPSSPPPGACIDRTTVTTAAFYPAVRTRYQRGGSSLPRPATLLPSTSLQHPSFNRIATHHHRTRRGATKSVTTLLPIVNLLRAFRELLLLLLLRHHDLPRARERSITCNHGKPFFGTRIPCRRGRGPACCYHDFQVEGGNVQGTRTPLVQSRGVHAEL